MSDGFYWGLPGLNKARFQAFVKLLLLRNGRQAEEPSRSDAMWRDPNSDDFEESDADSLITQMLLDFDIDHLKRSFLDRLSELVAKAKGGRHVAAAMMVSSPEKVDIIVAKNTGFTQEDTQFLQKVGVRLREIAAVHPTEVGDTAEALWQTLLCHYERRINGYVSDVRQELREFEEVYGADPHAATSESSLVSELKLFYRLIFRKDETTQNGHNVLALRAHYIYKRYTSKDFEDLDFRADKLRTSLGFLGRLRSQFLVLVQAAQRVSGFREVSIVPAVMADCSKRNRKKAAKGTSEGQETLTLVRAFQALGLSLNDDNVRLVMGDWERKCQWRKGDLLSRFNGLGSSKWEVHAEVQLLLYYIQAGLSSRSAFNYIGCSKRSCILCWGFLSGFKSFTSRGSHGKLYDLWNVPNVKGVPASEVGHVLSSLQSLEGFMSYELRTVRIWQILEPIAGGPPIATTIPRSDRTAITQSAGEYLQGQPADLPWPSQEGMSAPSGSLSEPVDVPPTRNEPASGLCENTTSYCSRCPGAWPCTHDFERTAPPHPRKSNWRPITSADYLLQAVARDMLPVNPQTREDYGFNRCKNPWEESHLLGLYAGLFGLPGVSIEEVHRWKSSGTLVDNIIEKFELVPEAYRGQYFPWFLRHRYILEPSDREMKVKMWCFFFALILIGWLIK